MVECRGLEGAGAQWEPRGRRWTSPDHPCRWAPRRLWLLPSHSRPHLRVWRLVRRVPLTNTPSSPLALWQVGLTTFVSTQPAFQQALCASGKMADLASKTQVGRGGEGCVRPGPAGLSCSCCPASCTGTPWLGRSLSSDEPASRNRRTHRVSRITPALSAHTKRGMRARTHARTHARTQLRTHAQARLRACPAGVPYEPRSHSLTHVLCGPLPPPLLAGPAHGDGHSGSGSLLR
jgi:hypothetical protein